MTRKKKPPLTFVQKMQKIISAGLSVPEEGGQCEDTEKLVSLEDRVKNILGITDNVKKNPNRMLFFVMYDIESNKVRTQVVKYLERCGCSRIQKSIFLAEASIEIFRKIQEDLVEVQAAYNNEDSIIVLPVTTDYLKMMKIIGKNISIDVITHSKNTLFF